MANRTELLHLLTDTLTKKILTFFCFFLFIFFLLETLGTSVLRVRLVFVVVFFFNNCLRYFAETESLKDIKQW